MVDSPRKKPSGAARSKAADPAHKNQPDDPPGEPSVIRSHRELAAKTAEIVAKLNRDPGLAKAMFLNPAAAIEEAGYQLSPEILKHISDTIRHSKETEQRRKELEARLEKELGEPPQPQDPAWLKRTLFEKLKIQPLETKGAEPVYRSPISGDLLARLEKLRPKLRKTTVKTAEPLHGTAIKVSLVHKSPRRLDLDAKLPGLKPASAPPEEVNLNTLYFYKDSHPLVKPLIDLAIIRRSTFPLHTPDRYRKIRRGEQKNPLQTWIKSVRFQQS